jgi:acetolactate synthase-1/2/3 large subunit
MNAPFAPNVTHALLEGLYALGVREAFGLVGGAIAPLCDTLGRSKIRSYQLRHEGGALFSAVEASLATGRPALAFVTTGPGLLNALTGAMAARWEGAQVILISGATSDAQRGRWAVQESGPLTLPAETLYQASNLFHQARLLTGPHDVAAALDELAEGLCRSQGFVAHLALPIALQRATSTPLTVTPRAPYRPGPTPAALDAAVAALSDGPFAVWVGWGARAASEQLRAFIEHTGAPVLCTPRGKGIFPESDPRFVGVTGCGGHEHVEATLAALGCRRLLVLGSRLGEFSSCWAEGLVPPDGFVHVDVDVAAFGAAYPHALTVAVQADVGALLDALRERLPAAASPSFSRSSASALPASRGPILPQALMAAIQATVVDGSEAMVLAESGNAFLWANNLLRFDEPGRYRVSGLWGSMGHATSGVLGLAVTRGKAFALVGDGAMLMMNEVSSAVQYGLPAVWVILNDARMGIVEKGMQGLGLQPFQTDLPPTDFAAMARAMGADGERVLDADDLPAALGRALAAPGPYVLDVLIDPDEPSPFARRVSTLHAMGAKNTGSGS